MLLNLTKIISLILQPSSLIAIGFLIGISKLLLLNIVGARRWLLGAFAAFLILGMTPLCDILIAPLENRFSRPDLANATITGIVVLGGSEDPSIAGSRNLIAVNDAAERLIETAGLARRFPTARVVFAGGASPLTHATEDEAATAARIFENLGIARHRITLENQSRTTWENALRSAPFINKKPGERWLLVTSAWHMPRAIGAFRKAGLDLEAYPVDYRTEKKLDLWRLTSGVSEGLRRADGLTREYPGLLIYYLTGRSDALFPAQTLNR